MRVRQLVPPQSQGFGDQRQLRCFQAEKYNLRALASGWEQRAVLPWRCLASFNSSISLSLVTSTLRHRERPVSSTPTPARTFLWQTSVCRARDRSRTPLPAQTPTRRPFLQHLGQSCRFQKRPWTAERDCGVPGECTASATGPPGDCRGPFAFRGSYHSAASPAPL